MTGPKMGVSSELLSLGSHPSPRGGRSKNLVTGRYSASVLSAAAVAAVLGGCSGSAGSEHKDAPPIASRIGELVAPEWEANITPSILGTARPIAFGAGHGVAGLTQREPCQRTIFVLRDSAKVAGWTRCLPTGEDEHPPPQPGLVTDVVYSASGGVPWYLEPRSGRVVSEDISGYRRLVTRLPASGPVTTACSTDGRLVVYIDSAAPGKLRFHDIIHTDSSWTVGLVPDLAREAVPHWSSVRFGGSIHGPCVLAAPRLAHFAIVLGDTAVHVAEFREPVLPPTRQPSGLSLQRWLGPTASEEPVGPLDAAGFPRGVAILFQGLSAFGGRLVDLYDLTGRYRETMILPGVATMITATPERLLVLSQGDGKWWLASYLLPSSLRGIAIEEESVVTRRTKPPPG